MERLIYLVFFWILASCTNQQAMFGPGPLTGKPDADLLVVVGTKTVGGDTKLCPLVVYSPSDTCDAGVPDPVNVTCRDKKKLMYWKISPDYEYVSITAISKSPADGLKNCMWNSGLKSFSCITKDTDVQKYEIDYALTITDARSAANVTTCSVDPTVILNY